jgi:hypothetical protein
VTAAATATTGGRLYGSPAYAASCCRGGWKRCALRTPLLPGAEGRVLALADMDCSNR